MVVLYHLIISNIFKKYFLLYKSIKVFKPRLQEMHFPGKGKDGLRNPRLKSRWAVWDARCLSSPDLRRAAAVGRYGPGQAQTWARLQVKVSAAPPALVQIPRIILTCWMPIRPSQEKAVLETLALASGWPAKANPSQSCPVPGGVESHQHSSLGPLLLCPGGHNEVPLPGGWNSNSVLSHSFRG